MLGPVSTLLGPGCAARAPEEEAWSKERPRRELWRETWGLWFGVRGFGVRVWGERVWGERVWGERVGGAWGGGKEQGEA